MPIAETGKLVTFGIQPSEPNTGYGYIKVGTNFENYFEVDKFFEKPDLKKAQEYLDTGEYLWNSGIFLFKAGDFLDELNKYDSEVYEACKASIVNSIKDEVFLKPHKDSFSSCPSISIDYSVMERTEKAIVVPLDSEWSDLGSWSALWEVSIKDENGNVSIGDTVLSNTENSYIRSEDKLIATQDVTDLVIVSTKDSILVSNKNTSQNVKLIVDELINKEREESKQGREVNRPWGKYDSIDTGGSFQVKRISVNPGAKLSVQSHKHRSEHWIVVSGQAKVRNGDNSLLLSENESTYIPAGTIHSLENESHEELILIEVQYGSYLGEDDIKRFEDRYGRI
jgi:mannose-1-phosphate guanylyltransferase